MNNQVKPRQLGIGLTLLVVLMLASCGNKSEDTVSTKPENKTAVSQANASPSSAVSANAQKLGVKPQSATACPKNAPIKGKVTNKRGNVYHDAKSPDYAKIKPDICFKDKATAEKAGFSVPK